MTEHEGDAVDERMKLRRRRIAYVVIVSAVTALVVFGLGSQLGFEATFVVAFVLALAIAILAEPCLREELERDNEALQQLACRKASSIEYEVEMALAALDPDRVDVRFDTAQQCLRRINRILHWGVPTQRDIDRANEVARSLLSTESNQSGSEG